MHMNESISEPTHVCAYVCVCMYVCTNVCMCVCICVCTCVCIYVCIATLPSVPIMKDNGINIRHQFLPVFTTV